MNIAGTPRMMPDHDAVLTAAGTTNSSARIRYRNNGAVLQFKWDDEDLLIVVPQPFRVPRSPKRTGATGRISYVIKYIQAGACCGDLQNLVDQDDSEIGGQWDVAVTDDCAIISSAVVKQLQAKVKEHLKQDDKATAIIVDATSLAVRGLADGTATLEMGRPLLSIRLRQDQ